MFGRRSLFGLVAASIFAKPAAPLTLTLGAVDMVSLETRRFDVAEICRLFGVAASALR